MRIERETVIAAPRSRVWDVVSRLDEHARVLAGVTRWEPLGDTTGLGSRFDVRLEVGSAQLGSVIEINEWKDECEFAWVSVSGIDHRGRFTLRDAGRGEASSHTRLRFRITYNAPGGVFGLVAGQLARPMLQGAVDRTVRAIKHH